eukprot:3540979-Ditylum_brightwellii.AAC.1
MSKTPITVTLKQQHPNITICLYSKLIKEQTQIGWDQIKYGWWSKLWQLQQLRYSTLQAITQGAI